MKHSKENIFSSKKNIILILIIFITIILISSIVFMLISKNFSVDSVAIVDTKNLANSDNILLFTLNSTDVINNNIETINDIVPEVSNTEATIPSTKVSDNSKSYYIKINNQQNIITIYSKDTDGNYTVPVKAMTCSTGRATPKSGKYTTKTKWRWLGLFGNVYGQYVTQITGNILFHSVPYTERGNSGSLEYWEYDKLGTSASMGCVRLTVSDAQWIYDNISQGTYVEFYSSSDSEPLGKPSTQKISSNELCRNWDPTDSSDSNPWNIKTNNNSSNINSKNDNDNTKNTVLSTNLNLTNTNNNILNSTLNNNISSFSNTLNNNISTNFLNTNNVDSTVNLINTIESSNNIISNNFITNN